MREREEETIHEYRYKKERQRERVGYLFRSVDHYGHIEIHILNDYKTTKNLRVINIDWLLLVRSNPWRMNSID